MIVVTHQFYNGTNGHKARGVVRSGLFKESRSLLIVDERPEEVEYFETTLSAAQNAREPIEALRPEVRPAMEALFLFMTPFALALRGSEIGHLSDYYDQAFIAEQLQWFATDVATNIVKDHSGEIPGLKDLFGFANALREGRAVAMASGAVVHMIGWKSKLLVRPGTLLLDATADIDGVSQIVPWRDHVTVPHARYDNLEFIHVPQHTKRDLKTYFRKVANRRSYVEHMLSVIREHVHPGERALVVCKDSH